MMTTRMRELTGAEPVVLKKSEHTARGRDDAGDTSTDTTVDRLVDLG